MVVSSNAPSIVFSHKWSVRPERNTAEAFRMNARIAGVDGYSQNVSSVKLRWLPKGWGLPEVYDRSSEKDCKDIVQEKLDEDVGSFKASLLPHWKQGSEDDLAVFTAMENKQIFFVSAAAVEMWNDVSLCTGVLSLMSLLFSIRFLPVPHARPTGRGGGGGRWRWR